MIPQPKMIAVRAVAALASVGVVTWAGARLIQANPTTAGFLYLIAILFISTAWGVIEATIASLASVVCFNYFFLPPVGTLTIADPENWVALLAFLATSITSSQLSDRARKRTREALERQREMERLYALSRSILLVDTRLPIPRELAKLLVQAFDFAGVVLYDRETDQFHAAGPEEMAGVEERLRHAALQGTQFRDGEVVVTAVRLGAQPIGGVAIKGAMLSDSALQSLVNLVAIGLERARALEAATRAEAARQSDELKATLLDAIAHEFKTPLTSIKAASTALLSQAAKDEPDRRELLSIVDEEADRLADLVTEAIQMARVEAGRVTLQRDQCTLGEIFSNVLAKVKRLEAGNTKIEIGEDVPAVWVDPEMIELALRQLADNAVKYSPAGSPVALRAERDGDRVIVGVADSGPGIPEAEQRRIFEKFYRAPDVRMNLPGAGMGLAIAREIVRAHGGDLWVESKPGRGSTFRFSIPIEGQGQR